MYIRPKGDDDAKWTRVTHQAFANLPHPREYEIKQDKPLSAKQKQALQLGQLVRHIKCIQAQAVIANRLAKSLSNTSSIAQYPIFDSVANQARLARRFMDDALAQLKLSGIIKQE